MKKNIEETNYLPIKKNSTIKKLHCMAFSINCAYVIFDNNFMAWIPQTENLYFDSLEYLYKEPIEFNNFGTRKILKIACNNFVVHAVSDDGQVYSWGNDREKNGLLGLGLNYNQPSPILNLNFSNKKIIDISLSEKHAAALDNEGNIFYFGTISSNQDLSKHLLNAPDIAQKHIDNVKSQEIFCGKNVLALIDTNGKVFLFNENEGLIKLRLENRIKSIKFVENNFYALTTDNRVLYEFAQKRCNDFSLNNYFENKFNIEEEFVSKIQLLEMPYYVNLLFFMGEFPSKIANFDLKRKVFKSEKNQMRQSNEKDRDSAYESLISGGNNNNNNSNLIANSISNNISLHKNLNFGEDKKINNNYINNINININNSGRGNSLIHNEIESSNLNDNNSNNSVFNHIKIAIEAADTEKIRKPILNLNAGNMLNKNLNTLISENTKKDFNSSKNRILNTNKNLVLITEPSENHNNLSQNYPLFTESNSILKALTPSNKTISESNKINNFKRISNKSNNNSLFPLENQSNSSKNYANNIRTFSYNNQTNNSNANLNTTNLNNKLNNINYNNNNSDSNISVITNASKLNSLVFPPNKSVKAEPLGNLNIGKYPEDYKNSVRINRISNLLGRIFNKKLNQIQNQKILQDISQNYPNCFSTQQNLNINESLHSYINTGGKMYESLSPSYRKRAEIEKVSLDELANLNEKAKRQKSEKSSNCFFNNPNITTNSNANDNINNKNFKNNRNNEYFNYENLKSKKYFDKFFGENEEKEIALNSLGNPKSPNEKAVSGVSLNRHLNSEANKINFYQSVDLSSCSVIKFELGCTAKKENFDLNSDKNKINYEKEKEANKSRNVITNDIDEFIYNEKKNNHNINYNNSAIVKDNKDDKSYVNNKNNNPKGINYANEQLQISKINNDLVLNSQQKNYANENSEFNCYNNNYYNNNFNDESDLLITKDNQIFHNINLSILSNVIDLNKNSTNNPLRKTLNFTSDIIINNSEIEENKNNNNNKNEIQRNISIMDNLSISEESDLNFNIQKNNKFKNYNYNNDNENNNENNNNSSRIIQTEFYQITKENESMHDLVNNIKNNSELILEDYNSENDNNLNLQQKEKNLNKILTLNNLADNNFIISNINNNPDTYRSAFSRSNNPNNTNDTLNNLNILNSSTETGKFPYVNYNSALSPRGEINNASNKNNNAIKIINECAEEESPNLVQGKQISNANIGNIYNKPQQKSNQNLSKISNRINNNNNIIIDDQEENEEAFSGNQDNKHFTKDTENCSKQNNNIINNPKNNAFDDENIYKNKKKYNCSASNLISNINNKFNESIKSNLNQTPKSPLSYASYPFSNRNSTSNILILENNQDDYEEENEQQKNNQTNNKNNENQTNYSYKNNIGKSSAEPDEQCDYEPAAEAEENFSENESEIFEISDGFNKYKNKSLNVISEEESNDLETINVNESYDAIKLKRSSVSKENNKREFKTAEKQKVKCANDFSECEKGVLRMKDLSVEEEENFVSFDNEDNNKDFGNENKIEEISQINKDGYNYTESNFNSPDLRFNFSNSNFLSNSNFKLNSNKNQELFKENNEANASDNNNNNINVKNNDSKEGFSNIIYQNKKKPSAQINKNNFNVNVVTNFANIPKETNNNNNNENNSKSNKSITKAAFENPIPASTLQPETQINSFSKNLKQKNNLTVASNPIEKSSNGEAKTTLNPKTIRLVNNKKELTNEPIEIVIPKTSENLLSISQKIEKPTQKAEIKTSIEETEKTPKKPIRSSSIKITSIERSRSRDRRSNNNDSNFNLKVSKEFRNNTNKFDARSEKLINKIIDSPNIKVIKKDFFVDDANEKSFSDLNQNDKENIVNCNNINKYKRNIVSCTDLKNKNNEEKEIPKLLINKNRDNSTLVTNKNKNKINFDITNEKLIKLELSIKKILFRDLTQSTFDYIQSIKLLMLQALKKEEITENENHLKNNTESDKNLSANKDINTNRDLVANNNNNFQAKPKTRIKEKQILKSNNSNSHDADLESSPVSIRNYQDTIEIETSLLKQIFEPGSRANLIPISSILEKKQNENQENFVISKITEFAIEHNANANNLKSINNNENNSNNNNFNNNEELENNSNFNSISFIEVYSNSISKFSNNNSEIINQEEIKRFYSIENISAADSPLFIMEKQVYLQLNSIRPNKKNRNNILNANFNSEIEKQNSNYNKNLNFNNNNNESNNNNNYYYNNNYEKSELENITEYIDLENMSSLSKSRISNSNFNNVACNFNSNTNQNSLENLNCSTDSNELRKNENKVERNERLNNTDNLNNRSKKPINNFNSSLLINNTSSNLNASNFKSKYSNKNLQDKFENNLLENEKANEDNENNLKALLESNKENNLEDINANKENKLANTPLSLSGSFNSPDSNRIKSLSDRLEKLKKAKSEILEKNKKIIQNNNQNKNIKSSLASDDFANLNIKNNNINNEAEAISYKINNVKEEEQEEKKKNNKNNQNQETIHSNNSDKAKAELNIDKEISINNDSEKKLSNVSNDFIKIVDNENIHKSNEKSFSNSQNKNSDSSLNKESNKLIKASPLLANQAPTSPVDPAAEESRTFTRSKENTNKTDAVTISPINSNYNNKIIVPEINKKIISNTAAHNEINNFNKYNNKEISIINKQPYKVKSMPSSETKKHTTKISLNCAEEDEDSQNNNNPDVNVYSCYKPHYTTANNFHNPNLFTNFSNSNNNNFDDYSINDKSNNYCETLNYTYTNSSGFETLKSNNNNNYISNLNADLLHTAEKAKRVFSPLNENAKNKKKLLTTEKKRNSEIKIIKTIKRDSLIKNLYSSNYSSAALNVQVNTAVNSNRNLSARKITRNNKSNLNLNANANSVVNNSATAANVEKNAGSNSNYNNNNNENKLKIFKSNPNFSNVKITNIIKKIKSRPSEDNNNNNNYKTFNQTNNTINNFNVTCFEDNENNNKKNNNIKNNQNTNLNLNHIISGNFYDSETLNTINNNIKANKPRTSKSGNKAKPNFPQYRNSIRNKANTENAHFNSSGNYNTILISENTSNINDLYLNTERNSSAGKKDRFSNKIISGNFKSNAKILNAKNSKANINIEEDFLLHNESNEMQSNLISDDGTENISSIQSDFNNLNNNPSMQFKYRDSSKANSVNSNPNVIDIVGKNFNAANKIVNVNSKNLIGKVNSQNNGNNNNEQKTWSNIKVKKDKNEVKVNYMITPNYTQNNPVVISNAERGRITNSKEKVKGELLNTTASKNAFSNLSNNNKNQEASSTKSLTNLSNINSSNNKPNNNNINNSVNTNNNFNNLNRNLNDILNNINPNENNQLNQADKASNNSSNTANSTSFNEKSNNNQQENLTNININTNNNNNNNPNNNNLKGTLNLRNTNTSNLINTINQKKSNLKQPNNQIQFLNTTNKNPIQVKFNNTNKNNNINNNQNPNSTRKENFENSKIKNSFNTSKGVNVNTSTSSLALDKCIENLKLALDNYIRASQTDKEMLKNIIRDNLSNIKKENELQKSLHRESLKNEAENKINFSINSNQSRFENNEFNLSNVNSNAFGSNINNENNENNYLSNLNSQENSSLRKLISEELVGSSERNVDNAINNLNSNFISEREINNNKDENNEVFDDNEFNKLSDDPEDIKNFIIKQLESFKLGLVKDRLEKYFEKLRDGTCTPRSLCSSPMRHLMEADEENKDKQSEYEPIELDRSQMTQMSLNGSLRKSFSNASNYYQDISNNISVNTFNFPSSNSLRGRYGSFNELINPKASSNFEPNSQKDLKSCNQRNAAEDLYEIAENSAEITDIASSRIDSNFSTLNNLKDSLENNINNANCNAHGNINNNLINLNNDIINNNENENSNLLVNLSNGQNSLLLLNSESGKIDNLNIENKLDTYDSLFNSLPPNSENFDYRFEEFNEINNCINNKNNFNFNSNHNNFDYRNLGLNDDAELNNLNNPSNFKANIDFNKNNNNSNNKAVKTVDVLTREFMNRKMRNMPVNKKDMKDLKLNNLKKILQSQQKNNY